MRATRGELPAGTVRLLFQPSEECSDEENKSGAARMIEDGAMDGVDAVFGMHVGAHLPAGSFYVRAGPIMAGADTFRATIEGVSAHAARPNEGVDALVLAAHVILACQNAVARRISPMASGVLTIGRIEGGVAENVLAERVTLAGTIRYFEADVRETLHRELHRALEVARDAGRPGPRWTCGRATRPWSTMPRMTELAAAAFADAFGEAAVADADPMMGAEDFALLLREAPGCFVWLGAALEDPREHHHPNFDIEESALPRGAACPRGRALRALAELGS